MELNDLNIRAIKPELVDRYGHSIQGDYFQGIESAYQYCFDVLTHKRHSGQAEYNACQRFLNDLNRVDIKLDLDLVEFVLIVANSLRHPKGPIAGEPFYLLPFMVFILSQMFGWHYTNEARETLRGQRRFIKTFWAVARGNSKTVVGAVASIVNMLLNENGNPIGTCSAPVQKQSRISFEDISTMIQKASPSIRKRFDCLSNEIRVKGGGKIIPTSSESKNLDGFRIAGLALCDEIHAHPDSSIIDVLSTGMQSSKDPQLLMITTAGIDTQSYGREMFDYACSIAAGEIENDRFLSVVYAVDKADEANWRDESVWAKANPALGHAVGLEALRAACVEADRSESARANFLTKHLNVWVDFSEAGFIAAIDLIECRDHDLSIDDFKGEDCYIGLDLASVSDLSALTYLFPKNDKLYVFQRSYLPRSALTGLKEKDSARYYNAQKAGELILTESEVTDMEYIKSDIVRATKTYNVKGLACDAAAGGVRFSAEMMDEYGIEMISVKQGFGLSDSAIRFQTRIKERTLVYNDSIYEWACVNALVKIGTFDDLFVHRPMDSTKKIDPLISSLIALSMIDDGESNDIFVGFI
ncbi:terminase large subunit [Aeromonas popoffii]|uniref:terminase large subunit n=1 Tax=Aeromonas popoffii TaxID=70856 RepID=UPI0030D5C3AB